MPLWWPLLLAGLLFAIGVYAVLVRRNAILVLMGVELMLNAVNINFVAFDAYLGDVLHGGYTFALFVIVIAAAEIGLALAIVLMVFRTHGHIDVTELSGREDALPATEADTVPTEPAVSTTPADPATPAPVGSDRSGEVVR